MWNFAAASAGRMSNQTNHHKNIGKNIKLLGKWLTVIYGTANVTIW